jgi:hypothetical protein
LGSQEKIEASSFILGFQFLTALHRGSHTVDVAGVLQLSSKRVAWGISGPEAVMIDALFFLFFLD